MGRVTPSSTGRLLPWPLTLLLIAGCVNINTLQSDFAEVERVYAEATALNAKKCTPREYALAESNIAFTQLEFEQGDPTRARQHLDIALENAYIALNTAPSCLPKDRDGDGITDDVDDCPNDPEDFDGVEDNDGCPDIVYDTDNDGLLDDVDECPKDPEDLDGFKDTDGCPEPDNDNDTILDAADACPMDPEDVDGYADLDGCPDPDNDMDGLVDVQDACPMIPGPAPSGCPPTDTDGDGFMDPVDRCPSEPGPPPDGCPILDSDRDGFLDPVDKCPLEPENVNEYMDDDGCPDVKPSKVKVANKQIVISEQIQFETGKAIIRPVSYPILDDVVQVMRDYPQISIRIEGHTDSDGAEEANQKLSTARAQAVNEYMLEKGISGNRMETAGFGESRPIDTNRTPEGKQKNRRVEFHITKGLDE